MFYSKRLGKKTNALQVFSDLMHILKRITLFLTKIYKVSNNMSPTIFNVVLHQGLPLITCVTQVVLE